MGGLREGQPWFPSIRPSFRKYPFQLLLSTSSYTMTIASFFSSFLPTIYADAPAPDEEQSPNGEQPVKEADSEVVEEADIKAVVEEEPEEDEPEDVRVFNVHHSQPFPKHLIGPPCHSRGM